MLRIGASQGTNSWVGDDRTARRSRGRHWSTRAAVPQGSSARFIRHRSSASTVGRKGRCGATQSRPTDATLRSSEGPRAPRFWKIATRVQRAITAPPRREHRTVVSSRSRSFISQGSGNSIIQREVRRNQFQSTGNHWCRGRDLNPSLRKMRSQHTGSQVHPVRTRMSRNYCGLIARKSFQTARRPRRSLGLRYSWRGQDLNLRPSGYEPDELPDCSTPRWVRTTLAAAAKVKSVGVTVTTKASNDDR